MSTDKRKLLYALPEYRVLDAKRKKLISFHLLDAVKFSRAATMLNLNKTRESKRADVVACLAAFSKALDPNGDAQMWETIRRLEKMWYGSYNGPADADFANVNLPYNGIFITPDCQPVDAAGSPVSTPRPPVQPTPPAPDLSAVTCEGCTKTILADTPRFTSGQTGSQVTVCGHCNHVWAHTGIKPAGPTDPNLARIEPRWGLNVTTVPDYVAPL